MCAPAVCRLPRERRRRCLDLWGGERIRQCVDELGLDTLELQESFQSQADLAFEIIAVSRPASQLQHALTIVESVSKRSTGRRRDATMRNEGRNKRIQDINNRLEGRLRV